ncbi:hypothetical protein [Methanoregula sp.]|uniref:hypothetical protein n=1 Tax=Methanoregula sp. TaxID=2052170 RepID=UPI003BB01244
MALPACGVGVAVGVGTGPDVELVHPARQTNTIPRTSKTTIELTFIKPIEFFKEIIITL